MGCTIKVEVTGHPGMGGVFPLSPGGAVTGGRSGGCDVVLDDQLIAPTHFRVVLRHGSPWIENLDPEFGIFVNGDFIEESCALPPDAEVDVGGVVQLRVAAVVQDDPPKTPKPTLTPAAEPEDVSAAPPTGEPERGPAERPAEPTVERTAEAAQPKPVQTSQPDAAPVPAPPPVPSPAPAIEPPPAPEAKPALKPDPKPDPKPAPKPAPKPVAKPAPKPAKPTAKPAGTAYSAEVRPLAKPFLDEHGPASLDAYPADTLDGFAQRAREMAQEHGLPWDESGPVLFRCMALAGSDLTNPSGPAADIVATLALVERSVESRLRRVSKIAERLTPRAPVSQPAPTPTPTPTPEPPAAAPQPDPSPRMPEPMQPEPIQPVPIQPDPIQTDPVEPQQAESDPFQSDPALSAPTPSAPTPSAPAPTAPAPSAPAPAVPKESRPKPPARPEPTAPVTPAATPPGAIPPESPARTSADGPTGGPADKPADPSVPLAERVSFTGYAIDGELGAAQYSGRDASTGDRVLLALAEGPPSEAHERVLGVLPLGHRSIERIENTGVGRVDGADRAFIAVRDRGQTPLSSLLDRTAARALPTLGGDELMSTLGFRPEHLAPDLAEAIGASDHGYERLVMLWLADLAEALQAAHDAGVVHGGLTPACVVLDARGVASMRWLGRYDASACQRDAIDPAVLGSLPPERVAAIASGVPTPPAIRPLGDLWSIGVLGVTLLTGKSPFAGRPAEIYTDIVTRTIDDPAESAQGVSQAAGRLCLSLMHRDPAGRPPYASAVAEAAHEIATGRGSGTKKVLGFLGRKG